MVATVYLDALFLLSGTVDFCILVLCGKLADATIRKPRLLLGSAFGGLYSVVAVVFCNAELSAVLIKAAISLLIVAVSFGFKTFGGFLRVWCTYLISNFAFIGCVLAVGMIRGEPLYATRLSSLLIAALFYGAMVSFVLRRVARARDRDATVRIEFCGKTCLLHALVDTGNFVKDPIDRTSVIVVELEALKGLFDPKTYAEFEHAKSEDSPYLLERLGLANRVRLIPYHTVGNTPSLMVAFRPDRVFVDGKPKNSLIALSPNRISKNGEFEALVGEDGI